MQIFVMFLIIVLGFYLAVTIEVMEDLDKGMKSDLDRPLVRFCCILLLASLWPFALGSDNE